MEVLVEHEFYRMEFDWLGSDESGEIGFFSSAGYGLVPEHALENADALADLGTEVRSIRSPCSALVHVAPARDISDWVEIATYGFHALDWRADQAAYELIASPEVPCMVEDLPGSLKSSLVVLTLRFSLSHEIQRIDLSRGVAWSGG